METTSDMQPREHLVHYQLHKVTLPGMSHLTQMLFHQKEINSYLIYASVILRFLLFIAKSYFLLTQIFLSFPLFALVAQKLKAKHQLYFCQHLEVF